MRGHQRNNRHTFLTWRIRRNPDAGKNTTSPLRRQASRSIGFLWISQSPEIDHPTALVAESLHPGTIVGVGSEAVGEVKHLITFGFKKNLERMGEMDRWIVIEEHLQAASRSANRLSN
jgi:hypothetical protein